MKNIDYKKNQLRVTISLGLIAFFITLIVGLLKLDTNSILILDWIKFVVLGTFTIPIFSFFIFIIQTATILKVDEPSVVDENIYVTEKNRMFFYNNGIKMTVWGIQSGTALFFSDFIIQGFNLEKVFWNLVIFFTFFIILFLLLDRFLHEIF